jgi:hypothetical protein
MDKRAIKRAYKEARPPMGVYRVYNRVADRSLVGSSTNVTAMLNRHWAQLKMGLHANRALQQDWAQLGEEAFAFEVLDTVAPREEPGFDAAAELRALEELWLERLAPYGARGYNAQPK